TAQPVVATARLVVATARLVVAIAFVGIVGVASAAAGDLTFSADRSSSVFAEGRERIRLTGNARVESAEFLIVAPSIEIFGDDQRYLRATGGVTVIDRENDLFLTSDEILIDRTDDWLRASGGAYMEDRANDIVVKGALIQNWNAINLTEISVNVRIIGDDYTARGQFARYRRDTEILELSGNPEVFWKGDEYRASRITIDLANDEIEFVGDVRATVRTTEREERSGE
ncbi:MAG: hypothetical protein EA382_06105, partial [Spirochaetaceae bacterium]